MTEGQTSASFFIEELANLLVGVFSNQPLSYGAMASISKVFPEAKLFRCFSKHNCLHDNIVPLLTLANF